MKTLLALTLALLPLLPPAAEAAEVADFARYSERSFPDGEHIHAVRNHPRFLQGAKYVGGLQLQPGTGRSNRGTVYKTVALMQEPNGRFFYRKFDVTVGYERGPRQAVAVYSTGEVDLAQTKFSAYVGILDRLLVLEDETNGITLAFPLGVGGIDENVMGKGYRSLTPRFKGAFLERKHVQPNRVQPAYFRGRPFIPITNASGLRTSIAFHITILSDQEVERFGFNYLVRGFESHGCMRMRESNLRELFLIMMNGALDRVPVAVDDHVWAKNAKGVRDPAAGIAREAHPHPMNTSSFMRVTRFSEAPFHRRDPVDGLVIMDRTKGSPDLRRLGIRPVFDLLDEQEPDFDLMMNGGY